MQHHSAGPAGGVCAERLRAECLLRRVLRVLVFCRPTHASPTGGHCPAYLHRRVPRPSPCGPPPPARIARVWHACSPTGVPSPPAGMCPRCTARRAATQAHKRTPGRDSQHDRLQHLHHPQHTYISYSLRPPSSPRRLRGRLAHFFPDTTTSPSPGPPSSPSASPPAGFLLLLPGPRSYP